MSQINNYLDTKTTPLCFVSVCEMELIIDSWQFKSDNLVGHNFNKFAIYYNNFFFLIIIINCKFIKIMTDEIVTFKLPTFNNQFHIYVYI